MKKPNGDPVKGEVDNPAICFLANFPPKECGIATFTKDLTLAMNKKFNPKLKSNVIALNEDANIYNYGERVVMEINMRSLRTLISWPDLRQYTPMLLQLLLSVLLQGRS